MRRRPSFRDLVLGRPGCKEGRPGLGPCSPSNISRAHEFPSLSPCLPGRWSRPPNGPEPSRGLGRGAPGDLEGPRKGCGGAWGDPARPQRTGAALPGSCVSWDRPLLVPRGSLGYSRLRRRLNLGADLGSGGPDIPPMGLCSRVSGPSRAVDVNTGHVSGGRAPQIKGPQREALPSHLRASGQ